MWPAAGASLRRYLACAAAAASHEAPRGPVMVYSWGAGSQGALGLGSTQDAYLPEHVPGLPEDIVSVGAGHYTSFAVTAQGDLWSWGRGRELQLGRRIPGGDYLGSTPRPIEGLGSSKVVCATGSGVASFAVTSDGQLLAWGTSKRGQLGLGPGTPQQPAPRRVHIPEPVAQVSAGWGHAAALTVEGNVYTWGWPADGRLGHSYAKSAEDEEEARLGERCVWAPRRAEALQGVRARQVVCGLDHTMVLADDGALFTLGNHALGQLGRLPRRGGEALRPQDAEALRVAVVDGGPAPALRRVAAGLAHCLAVTDDGHVLAWGWNGASQCGLGQARSEEVVQDPTYVPDSLLGRRDALLAAGRAHSVLATDEILTDTSLRPGGPPVMTMLMTWGSAQDGRLGLGQFEEATFPELVTELDGEEFLEVAAGHDHTLVLLRQVAGSDLM